MGVLNVTPDSFSDGGQHLHRAAAFERAARMVEEGADLIDIGGESTRPQAAPVSVQEELDRIIPVIEAVKTLGIPISVDTRKTAVMREALALGVEMINDVNALQEEGALALLAASSAQVCLMHMQGNPETMQDQPEYRDPVDEIHDFLAQRIQACLQAGIGQERLWIDPGFGFGKNLSHNLALLGSLSRFHDLHCPLAVGLSRKSMFGLITGKPVDQRMPSSLAAAVLGLLQGVSLIRTHEVAPTRDAILVLTALQQELQHESAS
jgi:dihydropteroate synthase